MEIFELVGKHNTEDELVHLSAGAPVDSIKSHPQHPYYVGVQFHPEYKSRPLRPSPPFMGLVLAASGQLGDHLVHLASSTATSPREHVDKIGQY